jgi:hypothetical protein
MVCVRWLWSCVCASGVYVCGVRVIQMVTFTIYSSSF